MGPDQRHPDYSRRTGVFTLVLLLALALALPPAAAASGPSDSVPLFNTDTPLEVHLAGPLAATQADLELRRERAFTITVEGADHPIEVRVRGNSRTRVCRFPPLRLDFPRSEMAGTVFEGIDKIKLVTHCRAGDRSRLDVMEEYAAYRLFNALTDHSYRARLLRIHYTDTAGKSRDGSAASHAFLIEPNDVLGDRLGLVEAERDSVRRGDFDPTHAALVYIFQYMLGNTDWSLVSAEGDDSCCHNGRLFESDDWLYYLPYDFDLAGLVNARYAKPDPSLRIRDVRKRLYRGYCVAPAALRAAFGIVLARRDAVMAVIAGIPDLDERARRKMSDYIDAFYREAGDGGRLLEDFHDSCL